MMKVTCPKCAGSDTYFLRVLPDDKGVAYTVYGCRGCNTEIVADKDGKVVANGVTESGRRIKRKG